VAVPEPSAPSATPSAPTGPTAEGPPVPLDAQPTVPMPAATVAQAVQLAAAGDAPPAARHPQETIPILVTESPAEPVAAAPVQAAVATQPDRRPSRVQLGPARGGLALVVIVLLGAGWLVAAALVLQPIVAPALTGPVAGGALDEPVTLGVEAVAAYRRAQQEHARAGDPEAVEKLAALPPGERTAAEALALAEGRRAQKVADLIELEQDVAANPALAQDRKLLTQLHRKAYDSQVAREALRVMAGLPGEAGADLLYAVWTHTTKRTPTTVLAQDLLLSKEVSAKASPALKVVLDLRAAEDCETRKTLLAVAQEHGDARVLRQLNLLKLKTGCGKHKAGDCHPCLRSGTELSDAIKAVVRRRPPRY